VQGPFVGLFVFTHEPLHDGPLQRQQRPSQARKHTTTRDVTRRGQVDLLLKSTEDPE